MNFIGDFLEDATVRVPLTTHDGAGGAVAPSSAFEAADIRIYKDGSATEKTTTNGITMTSPFDTVTGLHTLSIDTSNDTGDAGFWTAGSDYWVVLVPDETVDSQTVVSVLAIFSIENRPAPWNSAWDAEVQSEVTDALNAFGFNDPTSAQIADDVWDEVQSGHTGAGTFGEIATEIASILADTNELQTDDVPGLIAALNDLSQADIRSAVGLSSANLDTQLATLATAAKLLRYVQLLARSDAAIGTDLSTELGEINADEGSGAGDYDQSTDAQEALRDRGDSAWTTGGGGSAPTAGEVADAVWDESQGDHATAGSFGELATEIAAILVDTDTTIPGLIAALNDISTAQVNAEVDTALADYDGPTKAELDAGLAALDTLIDQVKAKTDQLTFSGAGNVDANTEEINETTITGDGSSGNKFGVS